MGLGTTLWGLTHITWYFPMLRTTIEALERGYLFTFLQIFVVIVVGILMFCLARRISYGVLTYGISKLAPDEVLDVRNFLNEMILFGLGSNFCVDGIVNFLTTGLSILPNLLSEPEVVHNFNLAYLAASIVQIIIALVLILGRHSILSFVGSFRTKEYGKKR